MTTTTRSAPAADWQLDRLDLDIVLGRTIALDLDRVQDKLVRRRRSGYCFEHNLLFAAALEPQLPIDYEVYNHYTATHPRSPFTGRVVALRTEPDIQHACAAASSRRPGRAARRRRCG